VFLIVQSQVLYFFSSYQTRIVFYFKIILKWQIFSWTKMCIKFCFKIIELEKYFKQALRKNFMHIIYSWKSENFKVISKSQMAYVYLLKCIHNKKICTHIILCQVTYYKCKIPNNKYTNRVIMSFRLFLVMLSSYFVAP